MEFINVDSMKRGAGSGSGAGSMIIHPVIYRTLHKKKLLKDRDRRRGATWGRTTVFV